MYDYKKLLPVFDPDASISENAELLCAELELQPSFILRRYWQFQTAQKANRGIDVDSDNASFVLILHFFRDLITADHPGVDVSIMHQMLRDYCGLVVPAQVSGFDLLHHRNRLLTSRTCHFRLWTVDQIPKPKRNWWD